VQLSLNLKRFGYLFAKVMKMPTAIYCDGLTITGVYPDLTNAQSDRTCYFRNALIIRIILIFRTLLIFCQCLDYTTIEYT